MFVEKVMRETGQNIHAAADRAFELLLRGTVGLPAGWAARVAAAALVPVSA